MRQTWDAIWQQVLLPDERILWQGHPHDGIAIERYTISLFLFSLPWWYITILAVRELFPTDAGQPKVWGGLLLPHSWVGPGIFAYIFLWRPFSRSRTGYLLSERRAITVWNLPVVCKRILSVPITPQSEFDYKPGRRASIYFTNEHQFRNQPKIGGFLLIPDGEEVYRLMQKIQIAQTR